MSGKAVTASLAVLSLLCLAGDALAQSQCGPRNEVVAQLSGKFKEAPAVRGLIGDKAMMEAFASEAGSWTILITNASGMACVIAAGEGFEFIAPGKQGEPL